MHQNKTIIGSWINTASPVAAEIMSAAGFDYLVVDAEHSAVDVAQAQALFQAIRAGNPDCVPMVRLPGNRYDETKRYLDAGAMGVIAPLVNSADEARELVQSPGRVPLRDLRQEIPPSVIRPGVGRYATHERKPAGDESRSRAADRAVVVADAAPGRAARFLNQHAVADVT